jgi:protein SCO1/2
MSDSLLDKRNPSQSRTALLWVLLMAGALACGALGFRLTPAPPPRLHGRDASAHVWKGDFSLVDTAGKRRTLADFQGKMVLLAFGYTRCPDACPTTLARLARVRQILGVDAGRLQVLFVTIDPERDTAQLLDSYVKAFDPSFIALRGNERETDAATRAFNAEYQITQYGKDVLVDHTVDTYLVDPAGQVREVLFYRLSAEDVAEDVHWALRRWD